MCGYMWPLIADVLGVLRMEEEEADWGWGEQNYGWSTKGFDFQATQSLLLITKAGSVDEANHSWDQFKETCLFS